MSGKHTVSESMRPSGHISTPDHLHIGMHQLDRALSTLKLEETSLPLCH